MKCTNKRERERERTSGGPQFESENAEVGGEEEGCAPAATRERERERKRADLKGKLKRIEFRIE